MKHQKSCGPRWGKLVHQLPGVVTFAYDLCLGCTIALWKDLDEQLHLGIKKQSLAIIEVPNREKMLFMPSSLGSLGPEKLLKIVSCQKNVLSQLENVGGHRDPPESILPP
jgi:hypothetical protein